MENIEVIKTTKNELGNGEKRIIKRKWWKVSIIVSVIFAILIGLGVGLYFALKPKKYNLNTEKINYKSTKNIRADIENGGGLGEGVAIYFYDKDDPITNYLMWDDKEGMKGEEKGKGILSEYIDSVSRYTWYAIELDGNGDEIMKDLFLEQSKDDKTWNASPEYEGFFVGGGSDFNETNTNSHYISNVEWTEEITEDLGQIHDEWGGIDITDPDKNSKDKNPKLSWIPKAGTTMWFDPITKMITSVIETYTTPENSVDENHGFFETLLGSDSGWWSKIEEGTAA